MLLARDCSIKPPRPALRSRKESCERSRNDICGYGFCHVPVAPGIHTVECPCWIPEGTAMEKITAFFVGGAPRLKHEDIVYSPGDRYRLMTRSTGLVHVQFQIVLKDFAKYGVVVDAAAT